MKILYLANIPSPYRVDFFNELVKFCDLTVLYERKTAIDRDQNWNANQATNYKEIFMDGINIGKDTALNMSVIKYLIDFKDEIIVIGGYSTPTGMLSIEFLKINNIPFIINADGGQACKKSGLKYIIKKHFISKASAWLSTSEITDDYFLAYGAREEAIFRYPFTSLHNTDILNECLTYDEKSKIKHSLGIEGKNVVLAVGRFIPLKNIDVLLKAWNEFDKNNTLCIIGSGPEKAKYDQIINELNLTNVRIIDFKQKDDLKYYYMCSDIFVHPTRTDVWGLVINEAMAHGLPIITTEGCVAGLELINNSENGFVVPIDDANRLYKYLEILLNNADMRKEMGQRNLLKISKYTIENMVERHLDIFKNKLK